MGFTFGVITDTHIRPAGGDLSSPYPVNDLANGRAGYAAALLAAQKPEFTVHLGDVVHPLPHLPSYRDACTEAKRLLAPLGDDVRYVPGNHDIGDKPHDVSPAGPVTPETTAAYGDEFGEAWYSFEHDGALFITINSSLINLGTEAEARQREWLEAELADHAGMRKFLFSHYPPFIERSNEPEHYDNYAEPGRSWLLNLTAEHGVEAIFSGHVHHFFYNRYRDVKLYCLPATSFTRQDYAELFPVAPAPEFGRDDRAKFMVTLVDVEESGHRLRLLPTDGRDNLDMPPSRTANRTRTPLTPHLRHAWARPVDLPYNGPMEEFSRKRARDDYPLLRLWQMGIDTVRTPLDDLLDPETCRRMIDWAENGIRFLLFSARLPTPEEMTLLGNHAPMITGLEIAITGTPNGLAALENIPVPKRLGLVQTSASRPVAGSKFTHAVSFGYRINQIDFVREHLAASPGFGATFQIDLEEDVDESGETIARFMGEVGASMGAIVRLTDSNPAIAQFDDNLTEAKIRRALTLADSYPDIDVQIDTFTTIDRGYSPRTGLIDRLSNLTPSGVFAMQYRS